MKYCQDFEAKNQEEKNKKGTGLLVMAMAYTSLNNTDFRAITLCPNTFNRHPNFSTKNNYSSALDKRSK